MIGTQIPDIKIFTGNANPQLAANIANSLNIPLGKIDVDHFSDGEIRVEINERVRGETAIIIQPMCAPTNNNLMELVIIADALRRSAAKSIIAVIPYYGYARQDRRPDYTRTPITSRLIADILQVSGIDQIITTDIHSGQQQGFFTIPVMNISASPEIIGDVWRNYNPNHDDVIIVSPDTGGVVRARAIAKQINDADLAIVDKRRPKANEAQVMNIIGDVNNKTCIIIDDMIDTAGTLCKAANALKEKGARQVVAYATHGIFSGDAFKNIEASSLDEVIITDTIPIKATTIPNKIRQLSMASIIAETIRRSQNGKSVSEMYV